MDFALSPTAERLRDDLQAFMDERVYPAEPIYAEQMREAGDPHHHPQVLEDLKTEAKRRGL
jgi:acyl-CoA dehydrogenase